jgi:hypothetical protein
MNRLQYMAPALVAALWSDPENNIRVRCQNKGIPANLRTEASYSQGEEQRNRRGEPGLRHKVKEKSDIHISHLGQLKQPGCAGSD